MTWSPTARAVTIWAVASAVAALLLTAWKIGQLDDALQAEGAVLHRVISQRAEQHDAHLTSLAAVAGASADPALLGLVADGILRFYPRILAIEVVAVEAPPRLLFAQGTARSDPAHLVAAGAGLPAGRVVTDAVAEPGRFRLLKRVGEPAVAVIAMTIDAVGLSDPEAPLPTGTTVALSADGRPLLVHANAPGGPVHLAFSKTLGSRSQPFLLQLTRRPAVIDLVPVLPLAAAMLMLGLGILVWRARHATATAARQAELRRQEARLAQAARVNSMGELASGIAHELAQPLTVLLSQSQAGQRLVDAEPLDQDTLRAVLRANVVQAKRAGDILARLRAYVRNEPPAPQPVDLNALAAGVASLLDLGTQGITLELALSQGLPDALADPIAVQQVLHNLLRNAAEAVATRPPARRRISLGTGRAEGMVTVTVADHGPGIDPAIRPRLFQPFLTTKPEGMGLGLSLSERLVNLNGGRIAVADREGGGAVFTVALPAAAAGRIAAE